MFRRNFRPLCMAAFVVLFALLAACQSTPSSPPTNSEPVLVTVEVTRESVVTEQIVATVAVPIEVTREVFVEVTSVPVGVLVEPQPASAVGSAENPLQLVISPKYGQQVAQLRGDNMANALMTATGLSIEVVAPASYAAAVDAACAAPAQTVALLTALEFVVAAEQCDFQNGFVGLRDDLAWSASMIMITDAEINDVEDLNDLHWGVPNQSDFANYLYFQALFQTLGVEPAEVSEFLTDASTVIAAYDGTVDFVTASYLPPILPYNDRQWEYGVDDPELWRQTGAVPFRSGIGFVVVLDYVENGGYRVRDARSTALDTQSGIFNTTDILLLSPQMPNDALGFSHGMSLGMASTLRDAIAQYTADDDCVSGLCSSDFFGWSGVVSAEAEQYDPVRFVIDTLEMDASAVFSYLGD